MIRPVLLLLLSMVVTGLLFPAWSQSGDLRLDIRIACHDKEIALDDTVVMPSGDTIVIQRLRFYLGQVSLLNHGKLAAEDVVDYHLIDLNDNRSMHLIIPGAGGITFDEIRFRLGVDSTTSVAGVLPGDLDPQNGMYWAWQSGYIYVKLEGWSPSSPTSDHSFEFHLGGYAGPYAASQLIQIPFRSGKEACLVFDLGPFFQELDMDEHKPLMSPGIEAKTGMQKLASGWHTLYE